MVRSLISLALLVVFVIFGATVPLGERTLFGHVSRIWKADETQDLVEGVKTKAGPLVDRAKRAGEAGWDAFQGQDGGSPTTRDGGASGAGDQPGKQSGESSSEQGTLDKARDRAADKIADKAGDLAKDVARREVKAKLEGE